MPCKSSASPVPTLRGVRNLIFLVSGTCRSAQFRPPPTAGSQNGTAKSQALTTCGPEAVVDAIARPARRRVDGVGQEMSHAPSFDAGESHVCHSHGERCRDGPAVF